ncbi:MAG: radical SAM protein [Acidobacteria bacterium]|nr:MAG: radical SAM protein [Acidobacteriota bacterium]
MDNQSEAAFFSMKLLLLQPPVQDYYDTDIRLQPIGLCYLKAAVKRHLPGVDVMVRDFHAGHGRRTVRVPRELSYLTGYYHIKDSSPFSLFSTYYHFGAPYEQVGRQVAGERPDLVGISSLFSTYQEEALRCAEEIKTLLDVPVVMGGGHATALPETVLAHPAVDFVIRGEGERPLVALVKALGEGRDLRTVPNLGFKDHGRLVFNPTEDNFPIEDLSVPDVSDLDPARYGSRGRPIACIVSSRGCPFRCDFCSVHSTFGRTYRRRSNESIIREIEQRYQEGYRVFDFEDDNFAFEREQTRRLLLEIVERFPPGTLDLYAMNGLCYFGLDAELLTLMKQAGFSQLNLSLVSGNPEVCAAHRRPCTVTGFEQAAVAGFQLGMRVIGYQILGLPGESLESMAQTMTLLARLPLLLGASVFYLAPGSRLWETRGGRSDQLKLARLTALATHSELVSRDQLYTLLVTARIINFLKGLKFGENKQGIPIRDVLEQDRSFDRRTALGLRLLRTLLSEGILCASDGLQDYPLKHFKPDLFHLIWSSTGSITTLKGETVRL